MVPSPGTVLSVAVQWHRVLDRALAESAVVGVADAVTQHLGRAPDAIRTHRRPPRGPPLRRNRGGSGDGAVFRRGGKQEAGPVLARPEFDLRDVAALRQSVAARSRRAEKPKGPGTKDTARRAESLLTQVSQSARAARLLPVDQIEPAHANLLLRTSLRPSRV